MRSLHQTNLNFQLTETKETITSRSGLAVIQELALSLGVVEAIANELPAPGSNRGFRPEEYVMPLALMFCGGGRTMEEIREIEQDQGLRSLCQYERIPSPDAIGQWLRKAKHLVGLKRVNRHLVRQVLAQTKMTDFTLDTDATYMETDKDCAEHNYEGVKSFSALMSFLAEVDLCLCCEYRNGNVSPATRIKEELEYATQELKRNGKRLAYFRSDSAGYTSEIINYCFKNRITFTITADQDVSVKELIRAIPAAGWTRSYNEQGEDTGRDYARTVQCMGKTDHSFTLIVQRWSNPRPDLFEDCPFGYHVIATNDYQRSARQIIEFHNQRSNAENYNKEIKHGFGMEYAPSQRLGANRAYFEIGVLAYNLVIAFKRLLLNPDWQRKTIATLRWELLLIGGKVVRTGRRLLLKVMRRHLELLSSIRERLKKVLISVSTPGLT
jgi:hypothetical protein